MYFCNMIFRHLLNMRSHPTWVRGLKHLLVVDDFHEVVSHPTWVRGLKLLKISPFIFLPQSHPTWVRGLKLYGFGVCYERLLRRTLRGCVD